MPAPTDTFVAFRAATSSAGKERVLAPLPLTDRITATGWPKSLLGIHSHPHMLCNTWAFEGAH